MAQAGFRSMLALWLGGGAAVKAPVGGSFGAGTRRHYRMYVTADMEEEMEQRARRLVVRREQAKRNMIEAYHTTRRHYKKKAVEQAIYTVFLSEV